MNSKGSQASYNWSVQPTKNLILFEIYPPPFLVWLDNFYILFYNDY